MKKLVAVFAVTAVIGVTSFAIVGHKDDNVVKTVYADASVTSETETEDETDEEVDLSPQAREYSDEELDASYDEYVTISLKDGGSTSDDSSVTIDGDVITITEPGTYELSGTLTDGQIIVNCQEKEKVQLVLAGVDITNTTQSPIYVQKAKDYLMITLKEGTTNTLTDATEYVLPETQEEELDATIYSKDDLVFNGTGTLVINANYNDAIKSNDTLLIAEGTYDITSSHDAIYGKDSVTILDGIINVVTGEGSQAREMTTSGPGGNSGGKGGMGGREMSNDEESTDSSSPMQRGRGFGEDGEMSDEQMTPPDKGTDGEMTRPDMSDGEMPDMSDEKMTPQEMPDGESMENSEMNRPEFDNTSSDLDETDEGSFKGIKSKGEIVINGGTITLDTYDDGINASTFLEINGGVINVKSGDDGIKADYLLTINDGNIDISYSYEGIEAMTIELNGGDINIVSTDDGINASDPDSSGGMMQRGGNSSTTEDTPVISFNGANVKVVASGDSVDSNGNIIVNDGVLEIHGVNQGGELALDFDRTCIVNGGNLLILGGSGSMSSESTQNVVTTSLSSSANAGDTLTIADSTGTVIFETVLEKSTSSVTFSSSDIEQGETYIITANGATTTIETSTTSTVTGSGKSMGGGGGAMGGSVECGVGCVALVVERCLCTVHLVVVTLRTF